MKIEKRILSIKMLQDNLAIKTKVDKILQKLGVEYSWGESEQDKNYIYISNAIDGQVVNVFKELIKDKMPVGLWIYYTPVEKDRIDRAKKYVNENLLVEPKDDTFKISYKDRHIQDIKTKNELDSLIDLSKKDVNLSIERWIMLLYLSPSTTTYLEYLKNILIILEYGKLEIKEYIIE